MRGPGDVKFRTCLQRTHKLGERLVFKWAFSVSRSWDILKQIAKCGNLHIKNKDTYRFLL